MKKYKVREILVVALFFLGFVGGLLFINLWGTLYLDNAGFLNEETLIQAQQTQIDTQSLFFYVLMTRGKWFLFFWLLGYTVAGIPLMFLFLGCLGFLAGVLVSIFVSRLQLLGILIFLSVILPQALLYAPAVWITAGAVYDRGIMRFKKQIAEDGWQNEKNYIRSIAAALAFLIAGAVLESCVNPLLLKQILKYFFA